MCDVQTVPPASIQLSSKLTDRVGTWKGESVANISTVTDTMKRRSGVILGEQLIANYDYLIKRQQQLLTRETIDQQPDLSPAIYRA